ncbi:MAG: HNH endonuclease family protein [Bacteroidota bacterium]
MKEDNAMQTTWGNFTFEEINRSVYRMGNLTLLERKLNREAGQKGYVEKIVLFAQSNSELTKTLPDNFNTWNEDKLAARQRELAKHAKAIWKIQELSNN